MKAVIGIDYGTRSARAVLINTANGEALASYSVKYPHGVMEGSLASAEDYENALTELLEAVTPEKYRKDVAGICIDATSLTLVCIDKNGQILSRLPEFADREQAQIKLWKRHAAQAQADEALALAKEMNEPFLKRTGGTISCEWTLPKLIEIRDQDPEVYARIDTAFDLCEFLTYRLTGNLIRSVGSMAYKSLWAKDLGLPSDRYLDALRPGFAKEYKHFMRGKVMCPGECVGTLRPEWCEKLGLGGSVAVAAGVLDGHTALVALGALNAGDAALVVGTSNVLTIQSETLCEIEGVCGIALNGFISGLYGIEAGQNCTGDMLEWFMNNALAKDIAEEAEAKNISPHQVLSERIKKPWENKLIAVDWWNGSRNAPCNLSLHGGFYGFSLETKPEDIYLALLQSIACGTRELLEVCASYGVKVKRVLVTGGIAGKNKLFMQEYAELLNLPVYAGQAKEGPALGSAIYAAAAAGIYPDTLSACQHMGVKEWVTYLPDSEHREDYERIYKQSHELRMWAAKLNNK